MRSRILASLVTAVALLATLAAPGARAQTALPPIGHVWVIVLENETYASTFGAGSKAPYLAHTLAAAGAMVPSYYGIGHVSLDNYVAMISGQGPNPVTQSDCQFYSDVVPGTIGADGQAAGAGCVYPAAVPTVAGQLAAKGLAWRGYMEDIGNSITEPTTCRHPALNSSDDTQSARAGDQYAARHDPFVYFHSIIDSPSCYADVVGTDRLAQDLRSAATTPSFSFITPNLCHDGHDSPCVDGAPGGLVSADQFLQAWVPQITASAAYRADGLLAIIFDEAQPGADSSACCGEQAANTPSAGGEDPGPGGGKTGAVLLSPFIKPGTVTHTAYNHYSLLRSVEDIFGVAHLGYAGLAGLSSFGADVFTASRAGSAAPAPPGCTTTTIRADAHGLAHRGELIRAARIVRRANGRAPLLALEAAHGTLARIGVAGRPSRSRRLRACHRYVFALPAEHGRVRIVATTGHLHERRVVRF